MRRKVAPVRRAKFLHRSRPQSARKRASASGSMRIASSQAGLPLSKEDVVGLMLSIHVEAEKVPAGGEPPAGGYPGRRGFLRGVGGLENFSIFA